MKIIKSKKIPTETEFPIEIEAIVKAIGGCGHVLLPKSWIGRDVKITLKEVK